MTHHEYIIIVTVGTMIFYALEIMENGRKWLHAARQTQGNRWLGLFKQCTIWIGLILLSSCVFTHLVLASMHGGAQP